MSNQVLLLNASYEPHQMVSPRRAILLVMDNKAEVVKLSDRVMRSKSLTLPVPSVIRLLVFVKVPYDKNPAVTRSAVLRHYDHKCVYCGKKGETVDHVIPRSRGGQNTWDNVVAACKKCNSKKANRFLSELGWDLPVTPGPPMRWQLKAAIELDWNNVASDGS